MRDEHAALDMVGALTIQDSSLQHASLLQALQTQQENLVNQFQRNLFTAFESSAQSENQENFPPNYSQTSQPVTDSDNISNMTSNMSSQSNSTEKSMVQMLQQMMNKMSELETKVKKGGRTNTKGGSNYTSKLNPMIEKPWKRYCWTYGCCDHLGKLCPNLPTGH